MNDPIALLGVPGSPYTRKMLALMRYRRIPYRLIIGSHRSDVGLPKPKVALLPTFYLPDAQGRIEPVVDSTPIIRRLERDVPGRSALPRDPALAFLDFLLEDWGDEWLTKAMFHYRWHYADDIARGREILPRWTVKPVPEDALAPQKRMIGDRQIARLKVVGSNPVTAPIIEASYLRFLELASRHLERHPFLLGGRPGAGDFALYGQLTQLTHFDPTPMALTLARAPRIYAWVDCVDDLSGLEPADDDWFRADALPDTLRPMFTEIGRGYVPVMLANAAAVRDGAATVETEVDGARWVQEPFPYQARCVQWVREAYAALDAGARATVDCVLRGTGCEALVAP